PGVLCSRPVVRVRVHATHRPSVGLAAFGHPSGPDGPLPRRPTASENGSDRVSALVPAESRWASRGQGRLNIIRLSPSIGFLLDRSPGAETRLRPPGSSGPLRPDSDWTRGPAAASGGRP